MEGSAIFYCSFVHGFEDPLFPVSERDRPCLVRVGPGGVEDVVDLPFLRVPSDFECTDLQIRGDSARDLTDFRPLPRFGITGLQSEGDHLYAGSWNGVYVLEIKEDAGIRPSAFLSNRLTADVHGLAASNGFVTTTLPPMDGVVRTDAAGEVVAAWRVLDDLRIVDLDPEAGPDWRFVGKQLRGPLGRFHFNNVELDGDRIWLTSRNLGAYVSFTPGDRRAQLHSIAHATPVMMHDGVVHGEQRFATSVDGKILVHGAPDPASLESFSQHLDVSSLSELGEHSLSEQVFRIDDELGRMTNWCRGLEVTDSRLVTTVDGRYGSGQRFSIVELDRAGSVLGEHIIRWEDVGPTDGLRYVTGFDVTTGPRRGG